MAPAKSDSLSLLGSLVKRFAERVRKDPLTVDRFEDTAVMNYENFSVIINPDFGYKFSNGAKSTNWISNPNLAIVKFKRGNPLA